LDGLVLIGASHTLTDASILTEYFLTEGVNTRVVGVPCTLDGNVYHEMFEQSVGFDSASKLYGQLIGNLMTDAASAVKYWYFIRLMGRDPSHLAIECALNTQPNYVVVSEEMV
jgi:6-phosphofructokinase